MSDNQKTPLYQTHIELGARMAPFGGFEMPIQYSGIFAEHEATRKGATLFDTCHMGEFFLSGESAVSDLEHLLSCPIADMQLGQCRYGLLCNPEGGVIDDLLVYRIDTEQFMLVVNAGTQTNDYAWIQNHLASTTTLENRSDITAKIDLQGPESPAIMNTLFSDGIADLRFYRFKQTRYQGADVIVSRTGYTGEVGFEVYLPPELAATFWCDAMDNGAISAGLGARDTLRLEMGMPLYGHELSDTRNAAEAGLTRAVASPHPFIGHDAIRNAGEDRLQLVGMVLEGRQAARHGDAILSEKGDEIGVVTSGSFAPSLGHAIALGYIPLELSHAGTSLQLKTARKALPATLVELPFYNLATARKPLTSFSS
jgi:aminomethyltransferase